MKSKIAVWFGGFFFTLYTLSGVAMEVANGSIQAYKNIQFTKIIELSHKITPEIPLWPGDPAVEFETVATIENEGYFLRRFSIGEHSATHMNAPNSFFVDGASIDQYRPEQLVNPAVVIDVRAKTRRNADYVIDVQDVVEWEQRYGRIPKGALVLFYTGWQELWHAPEKFLNIDSGGGLHFPGIGGDTTKFLLQQRNIAGVGIDTHGVDPGQDEIFATNKQVLQVNGIVLECLNNLDKLPPKGATLVIGLLKLQQGSGAPVSVMAFLP